MKNISKRAGIWLVILLAAFVIRLIFVNTWVTGDVLVIKEWGEKFSKTGPEKFYYSQDWYYSRPTQPPITSLMAAASFWLFDKKYVLPQLHNSTRLIPSAVINYFYDMKEPLNKKGHILLVKLPAILADIALGMLLYKLVLEITKSKKKAYGASLFYLFNPVTVFLSAGWGQTESWLAFFGVFSFYLLVKKRVYLSLPLLFVSLYTKPTWIVLLPLYLFVAVVLRPKLTHVVMGILVSVGIFLLTTLPFSGKDIFSFSNHLIFENILSKGAPKASISAFNFHSLVFTMDKSFANEKIVLLSADKVGLLMYGVINLFTFLWLKKQKKDLLNIMVAVFSVSFGSFLFLTSMLERYFFAAFVPLVVILFSSPRSLAPAVTINLIVFANLVFAYFRRSSDEIGRPFTNFNFLLIRILSLISIVSWLAILDDFGIVKLYSRFTSFLRAKI